MYWKKRWNWNLTQFSFLSLSLSLHMCVRVWVFFTSESGFFYSIWCKNRLRNSELILDHWSEKTRNKKGEYILWRWSSFLWPAWCCWLESLWLTMWMTRTMPSSLKVEFNIKYRLLAIESLPAETAFHYRQAIGGPFCELPRVGVQPGLLGWNSGV